MTEVLTERITRTPGVCGGKTCLAGHRVRVMDIVIMSERLGMSADDIVTQIPSITLSEVHSALAYYFDHLDEIREETERESESVSKFMSENPSALEAKLRAFREGKAS